MFISNNSGFVLHALFKLLYGTIGKHQDGSGQDDPGNLGYFCDGSGRSQQQVKLSGYLMVYSLEKGVRVQ